MKRILFVVLLFPLTVTAQLLEVSLKGGIVPNRIGIYALSPAGIKKELPTGSSFSVTVGLPFQLRFGASVSIYRQSFKQTSVFPGTMTDTSAYYQYGKPFMPIELVLIKRIDISKFSADFGILGGICTNNKLKISDADRNTVLVLEDDTAWFTYGFTVAGQVKLTKRFSAGVEAQPKWWKSGVGSGNIFMVPVFLKASVGI